jgi:hypothetical protein
VSETSEVSETSAVSSARMVKGMPWRTYLSEYRRNAALPRSRREALAPLEAWMAERQISWSRPAHEALRRLGAERPSSSNYIFKLRSGETPIPEGFIGAMLNVLHVPEAERSALLGVESVDTGAASPALPHSTAGSPPVAARRGSQRRRGPRDLESPQAGRAEHKPSTRQPEQARNWTVA